MVTSVEWAFGQVDSGVLFGTFDKMVLEPFPGNPVRVVIRTLDVVVGPDHDGVQFILFFNSFLTKNGKLSAEWMMDILVFLYSFSVAILFRTDSAFRLPVSII